MLPLSRHMIRVATPSGVVSGHSSLRSGLLALTRAMSSSGGVTEQVLQHVKDPSIVKASGFVGGKWVDSPSGSSIPLYNPATGEQLASVSDLGAAGTEAAISEAAAAFEPWSSRTGKERAEILRRYVQC